MSVTASISGDFQIDSLAVKQWKFPCGEVGVQVQTSTDIRGEHVDIVLRWEGNDDLIVLAQLVEALRFYGAAGLSLTIPYLPYSRQDRRCNLGESHALKVIGQMINSMGFNKVFTDDVHSTVAEGIIDNLRVMPQEGCAVNLPKYDILVAPDAGAEKKVYAHKQVQKDGTMVLTAQKTRAPGGKITGVTLHNGWQVADLDICIVDDICDGGATFLALGSELKKFGPKTMDLYVTHGFFTNPDKFVELYDLFDTICVYNLWNKTYGSYVTRLI